MYTYHWRPTAKALTENKPLAVEKNKHLEIDIISEIPNITKNEEETERDVKVNFVWSKGKSSPVLDTLLLSSQHSIINLTWY